MAKTRNILFVDQDAVNFDDLMKAAPASIVRVRGNPHDAILYLSQPNPSISKPTEDSYLTSWWQRLLLLVR